MQPITMENKKVTKDMMDALCRPLPAQAVTPHPTKSYLSSIKSIYVTERLNEVFGVGAWRLATEFVEQSAKMVVVKVRLSIPEYGIEYECFGGNDNSDLGDAYKGATTDALTKIASWMGIGSEVFKGEAGKVKATPQKPKQERRPLSMEDILDPEKLAKLCLWLKKYSTTIEPVALLRSSYDLDTDTENMILAEYKRIYA